MILPGKPPLPLCIVSAVLALAATGCRSYQQARFNRGRGIDGESVLVIPFSEPRDYRWYTESKRGALVAEAFKAWVYRNDDPNFPEGEAVEEALRVVGEWNKEEITVEDWRKITHALGAKYLLVGEIEKVQLTKPELVGLYEPTAEASYRLINLETGRLALDRPDLVVSLSQGSEIEIPTLELGSDPKVMEKKLLGRLGQQIAQELYGYYPGH